ASREPTSFQRLFSRRDLLRGAPLRACLYLAASSLLLCLGLVDLALFTDLLVHRGKLTIPASSQDELTRLVGTRLVEPQRNELPAPAVFEVTYLGRGLLPAVWNDRERFFGPALAGFYSHFSPLQDDLHALVTLVTLAALFGWLRSMFEARARILLLGT